MNFNSAAFQSVLKGLRQFSILIISGLLILNSCKQEKVTDGFTLRIRLKEDPDCLHPILSKSSIAGQIESMIMLPMIEFSPDKIELSPLLVTAIPKLTHQNDSADVFEFDIRPEAKWDDGSQVTANDYAFTVKAALNPYGKNPSWKSFLRNIKAIEINKDQPLHLSIQVEKNYLLSKEICGNINLYQENFYDQAKHLIKYQITDLLYKDSIQWSATEKEELKQFATDFENAAMCKNKISGSGPYKLKSWEAGSKIVLERKKNWWAEGMADSIPMMHAFPDQIEYLIIPEEAAAVLALKDGSIDLAIDINPKQFVELQNDNLNNQRLKFFTPTLFQYSYIDLNTRKPALASKEVRRALAYLLDVDGIIKNVMLDLAQRIESPIHPSRTYYNKDLKSIQFSIDSAIQILNNDGWKDKNHDGILEKQIQGKTEKLSFHLLVSSELGKKIALIYQEAAKKAGVEIIPELKEMALIIKDMSSRDFDMAVSTLSQSPSLYDPYQSWHSSNAKSGGSNHCGFSSPQLDSLIQIIRSTSSETERNNAYLNFQKLIYDEQPQIFLFSQKQRLIANSRIEMQATQRRPGYTENMISLKK
jgi:peptide/nickel transport system substrate-binding protein